VLEAGVNHSNNIMNATNYDSDFSRRMVRSPHDRGGKKIGFMQLMKAAYQINKDTNSCNNIDNNCFDNPLPNISKGDTNPNFKKY